MNRTLLLLALLSTPFAVAAQLTIQTSSLPDGVVWTPYSQALTATGGTAPYTWSISAGQLPNCLTISTAGTISGTPCAAASFGFTARVTDSLAAIATKALSIRITQPLMIQNLELSPGIVKIPYAGTTLAGAGGTGPYTFTQLSVTDAPGISFSAATGTLSGTPTAVGSYTYTFRATDSLSATADRTYTLTIEPPGQSSQWNRVANTNGGIYTVMLSPKFVTDSTVFAMSGGGALFRSTDNGATFTAPAPQALWPVYGPFALSPIYDGLNLVTADARTLFRKDTRSNRVWKSTDHGVTYALANGGLPTESDYHHAIAFSPDFVTDRTLYTTASSTATSVQLYRTLNAGTSWTLLGTIATGCPTTCADILDLQATKDGTGSIVLFAVSSYGTGYALHRSGNGGSTWQLVDSSTGYTDYIAISLNFAIDRTVVYTTNYYSQIRISTDGGLTFSNGAKSNWRFGGCRFEPRTAQNPRLWCVEQTAGAVYSDDYGRSLVRMPSRRHRVAYTYGNGVAAALDAVGMPALYLSDEMGLEWSQDQGRIMASRDNGIHTQTLSRLSISGSALLTGGNGYWMQSDDAGQTLTQRMNDPLMFSYPIASVTLSRSYAADGTLFLANYAGLYRSVNRGATFSELSTGLPVSFSGGAITEISPDYTAASGVVLVTAGSGGPLYRSADGGSNFALVSALNGCFPTTVRISDFQFSPSFAMDNTVFLQNSFDSRLCASTDRGITWVQVGAAPVYAFSLSPVYNQGAANGTVQKTVYIGSGSLIQRSTDGGVTRTTVYTATGTISLIALSPAYPLDGMILALGAGTRGFYRSDDSGASFSNVLTTSLTYRSLYGFAFGPGFDGRSSSNSPMYASVSGDGLYRSTDGGRSFVPVATQGAVSFLSGTLRTVASDGGTTVYAGTENQGIFRSTDEGGSFSGFSNGLTAGLKVNAIQIPDTAPANPIAAVEGAGLWRLSGTTWSPIASANAGTYTSFVSDGTRLYAARSDGTSMVSVNNGSSWSTLEPAQSDLVKMDYNPQLTPTFLTDPAAKRQGPVSSMASAVTASLWGVSQGAGPRYSTDNGTTWTPTPGTNDYVLPAGSWSVIRALGVNATSGSREVVAGTTTGLYRSNDGGVTWKSVSGTGSGLEATSKNFSATLSSTTVFGGTDILVGATGAVNGGVYLSGDGGEHWTQVNAGYDPNNLSISSLVYTTCTGCPVQYYSGSYGGGMYTRTITVVAPPTFPAANYSCYGSTTCTCATGSGSGPEQGGQAFKICGSNFQNGLVVEFDGVPAIGCTQTGGTVITCTATPPHAPSLVSIRVRNPDTRIGFLPAQYTYTAGTSRASNLRVAKSGADAVLTWNCAACSAASPARINRSQNSAFSVYVENYNGGISGAYTNAGAVSSAQSYFWSIE